MKLPTVTIELPVPYPKQRAAIWGQERIRSIEASTKCGKSEGCAVWLLEQAFTAKMPRANWWWVAPVHDQAEMMFDRIVAKFVDCGYPKHLYAVNNQKKAIALKQFGTLRFRSGEKPDNLYGEDVYGVVLDEATRMREAVFHAIRSTVTKTRGKIRIISNVKGRGNWVYKLGVRARSGEYPELGYSKLTALDAVDAGIFPMEEFEEARNHLPEHVFKMLYMAEPADDGGNPFGIDHIAACVKPLSDQPVTHWGIDLAKSVDWSVAIGLDANGDTAYFEKWRATWDHTTSKIEALVGDKPALIDSTGVGDPIVERMGKSCPRAEGFKFTSTSKQTLMEGLAVAIQRGEVGFPDGPIREELEIFEYVPTRNTVQYSAPDGQHDDCVCALALAVQCRANDVGVSFMVSDAPSYAVGEPDDEWGWVKWN